jgi:hypothetical protein
MKATLDILSKDSLKIETSTFDKKKLWYSEMFATLFAALLVVIGFTSQNVTIVFWTDASVNAFGILLLCGTFFGVFFGAALLIFACIFRDAAALAPSDDAAECRIFVWPFCRRGKASARGIQSVQSPRKGDFRGSWGVMVNKEENDSAIYEEVNSIVHLTQAQVLFLVGFLNSLNGFLIVYASPSQRTPPLVQAIIQNAGVIFSVPFSLLALGDKKRYCSPFPAFAAFLIAASVAVSLTPAFLNGGGSAISSTQSIGWCIIYLFGVAASAAFNVCQQLFFIRSGMLREEASAYQQVRTMLRALFWSNVAQPVTYILMFWVDLLPWFGTSDSINTLLRSTTYSMACSLGGPKIASLALSTVGTYGTKDPVCEDRTPIFAWAFLMSYVISYIGGARLNRESATFMMLTLVVVTMTTATFWLIPGTNPNPSSTPLWSVLTSLGLSIIGTLLWKWWENQTPADEQFSVEPDSIDGSGGGGGGGGGDRDGESGVGGDFDLSSSLLSRFDDLTSSSSEPKNQQRTNVVAKGSAATRFGGGGFFSSSSTSSGNVKSGPRLDDSLLSSAYDSLLLSPAGRNDISGGPKQDLLTRSRSEVMGLVAKFQMESAASNQRRDDDAKRKERAAQRRPEIN